MSLPPTIFKPPKSLAAIGYGNRNLELWKDVVQPRKKDLDYIMGVQINTNYQPDLEIHISDDVFNCHLMVLQCYSKYFRGMTWSNEPFIELSKKFVKPWVFKEIYSWMIGTRKVWKQKHLVLLYVAARNLGIGILETVCLEKLNECHGLKAYKVYLKAKHYRVRDVQKMILPLLDKYFLSFVTSNEFLKMSSHELCMLLSNDNAGVNSETEVFFAAVLWLTYDIESREKYAVEVMNYVRFDRMKSLEIRAVNNNLVNIPHVNRIMIPIVKKMVKNGLSVRVARDEYGVDSVRFKNFVRNYMLENHNDRAWVYDKWCAYHHLRNCIEPMNVSYEHFINHLHFIKRAGAPYCKTLKLVTSMNSKSNCKCVQSP